ncbi:hypothetical protein M0802_002104 [Mischocyttarus mexicanus]|nr:hypothetical protein M0802_002104 [Mischocyttarus mexicanus]
MPNKVAQSSNTKCNLSEQINQDEVSGDLFKNVNEIVNNRIVKSTGRNDNIDLNNKNLITNDREIRVVPFNKLGTVFKKRRKVKFYKLGPVKKESLLNSLTTMVLNSCKTNLITFEETNDLLETFNMKEQCNLLERNKSIINSIVRRDISNNQIDLLKDKDMNCLSKKSTQDSLDVLLISLKELNNENIVNVNEQRSKYDICKSTSKKILENHSKNGMYSKPMITSIVKMISPEDDSQLKYLNLESMVQQPTSKVVSNNSIGLGSKRKSDRNNDDSSLGQIINDKKRKFIDHNLTENLTRNIQIKESSDENDSDNSKIGNNVTQIDKFNVGVVDKINNNENINTVISLSSESENNMNDNKLNALNKSKKHNYKRIMIAHSSSDTDTSQTRKRKIDVNENKDKKKVKVNLKEVMTTSDDSDDDNLVNEILSNWCNDSANNSIKSMKKMNFNKTKDLKAMVTIPQSIDFDTWNNYDTPNNIIPEKEPPERSNNDIIDKVKMIQMDENNKVISNKIKKDIDDLEEAEVITGSLGRNFFTDEENIIVENRDKKNTLPAINSSYMDSNDFFADFNGSKTEENFDDTLVENLDGSNKENKTTGYLINNKNDNIICKKNIMTKQIDEDKRRTTVPATIITNITTTNTNTNTTLISDKEKYLDHGKSKGQLIEQKDTSCEYDSLMNVTQDQLLLKALEEDLFGTGNSRSLGNSTNTKTLYQERRLESSSQTPTKSKKNLKNAQNVEEFSSDEDEIIENTPDKKFMEIDRNVNSKARKSLTMLQTTSPASSKKFQQVATKAKETTTSNTTTPSFKLKNPIDQNKIQPLHQSTPKIIQKVFYRDSGPSCYENKEKSIESNKNLKEESRIITSTTTTTTNTTKTIETKVNNKRLCFVWSSLTTDQIDCIKKLSNLIDATWTQNFNTTVTHVIVSTKEHTNAATKTLKFLQGIAHRKFVVSFKWIVECLKEGTLIDEEPYEAVDCYTLEAGPRKSRLRENDLFKGFAFLCIEPFQNITVIQFQDLLRGMGGTIVQNMNTLAVIKDMHKIILIQNEMHTDEIVANWYNKTSAVPISCDWVVECISQYRLVSCYTHLHDVVQEDVLKLGYPEEMIDPDEFNSTSDTSVGYKSR